MELLFKTRYTLEITCADTMYFMSKLTEAGVITKNVLIVDAITARMDINGRYLSFVNELAERLGGESKIICARGLKAILGALKGRLVLVCGITFMILLTLYIPSRILFVSIEGNKQIDETYILEQAEQVGIFFGASRREVRSERMKNALLQAIPELKWAGINTYGCLAVIHVLERDTAKLPPEALRPAQGIYAARDGIVSSVTVTKGTAMCKPGQAIRAGQLLVSGYTDCGLITRAEQADGEIRGVTQRRIDALSPNMEYNRGEITHSSTRWSLQIGKKQIKLHIGSGNSGSECGKIYETYNLTLPGGYSLPISVAKETVLTYSQTPIVPDRDEEKLTALANQYVLSDIIDGKIVHTEAAIVSEGDLTRFTGVYTCEESIGKLQYEEIK